MADNSDRKERRPQWQRKAIRAIMVELECKYTAALREFERRNTPVPAQTFIEHD